MFNFGTLCTHLMRCFLRTFTHQELCKIQQFFIICTCILTMSLCHSMQFLQLRTHGEVEHNPWKKTFFLFQIVISRLVLSDLRVTAIRHYFRGLDRYKNDETKFNQHLICRSLALASLRNDGSVKRWSYFAHVGKGRLMYMNLLQSFCTVSTITMHVARLTNSQ